jgi:hypothetical protein
VVSGTATAGTGFFSAGFRTSTKSQVEKNAQITNTTDPIVRILIF